MKRVFSEKVYQATKQIPSGKVATYGQIAKKIGKPRAARAVGNALHHNPDPKTIPCHRVVNREGRLAPDFGKGLARKVQLGRTSCLTARHANPAKEQALRGTRDFAGWQEHKRRLLREGVKFRDEKYVDLEKHKQIAKLLDC